MKRPLPIAVVTLYLFIAKIVILTDTVLKFRDPAIKFMFLTAMSGNDIPVKIQLGIFLAYSVIVIISAVAMWNAKNWGRLLYMGATIIILAFQAATSPLPIYYMLPQVLWTVVFFYILFGTQANAYFKTKSMVANLF